MDNPDPVVQLIVLDTNIFCQDYRLRGSAFRLLQDGLQKTGVRLAVPKIVLEETVSKYRDDLIEPSFKPRTNRDVVIAVEEGALEGVGGQVLPEPVGQF